MERRKKANTPLEQIFYNTQDIKQLEEAIAPFYNCSIDLSNDSVSVAVSNTNLPTDITKAYITDYNGNVYKFIAFNDDKTTAYIEYYASLKGADGRDAVDDIDDTTTASNKLWSSEKTSAEITNATKIKVVYTTTDTPTTSGSSYIFDKNNITPAINDASIIGKEIYQIVDSKIKYAYRVNMVLNDDVYTSLIGEFGGGKQLYQHNIYWTKEVTRYYNIIYANTIINDKPIMSASDFIDYLGTNNYVYNSSLPTYKQIMFKVWGYEYDKNNDTQRDYYGVVKEDNFNIKAYIQNGSGTQQITDSETWTFVDDAQPL